MGARDVPAALCQVVPGVLAGATRGPHPAAEADQARAGGLLTAPWRAPKPATSRWLIVRDVSTCDDARHVVTSPVWLHARRWPGGKKGCGLAQRVAPRVSPPTSPSPGAASAHPFPRPAAGPTVAARCTAG